MRILITGGAGFQGTRVAESCLRAGHQVTILNTFSERATNNIGPLGQNVSVVWGSITDPEIVEKTVRGQQVIIHMAAHINVDESIERPSSFLAVNVMGTYNVLEAVRHQGCRLIFASSCEVYGDGHQTGTPETADLRPHSPYAASKAAADRLCFAYWKTFGVDVVIVRPCNIYGPGQKSGPGGAVIPTFVDQALEHRPLRVSGTGEQRREYMHVDDLVRAYHLVLQRNDLQGEAINFGTGETPSIKEIAEFIARQLNASVEYTLARSGEVKGFKLDCAKASLLGFSPRVEFWEGLNRYVRWRTQIKTTAV